MADSDDMGAMFQAQREATRQHRAAMLAQADTTGWKQHTPYHFSRQFKGGRVEWWPSGGKCQVHVPGKKPRMVYGHRNVAALLKRLKDGEPVFAIGHPRTPRREEVPCPVRGCRARISPLGVADHVRDCHE